jgi:hypothetical protein
MNACFRAFGADGVVSDPRYFFSVNDDALPHRPRRVGMIYILPRAGFEQQPHTTYQGADIEIAQWTSLASVRPLAKLTVDPDDFPFLGQIRAHNIAVVNRRAERNPNGLPWLVD